MAITLGADPEFFLFDNESGQYGQVVQSVGIVPGTKEKPHDLGNGFGVHEDNVLVELTVPPTKNSRSFALSIMHGKDAIQDLLGKRYALRSRAAYMFPQSRLRSAQAQQFGCEPDYNAYTAGKMRMYEHNQQDRNRYAGGHIHIGVEANCPPFVVALLCDIFITLPLYYPSTQSKDCWLAEGGNAFYKRLQWYGQPGIYRPKPYGIEYRTPSSIWTHCESRARQIGDRAMALAHYVQNTSATQLRESVSTFDWLALQTFLASPPTSKVDMRDQVDAMLSKAHKVFPV